MFIEVFLLDNLVLDLLILRLAAALLSARPPLWRQLAAALAGAAAAALAAYVWPALRSAALRAPLLLMMSFAFEARGLRGRLAVCAAVAFASLVSGGAALAAAQLTGGGAHDGLITAPMPLRAALAGALLVSALPSAARRMASRRVKGAGLVRLTVLHKGVLRRFTALVDTGNTLAAPISGLPVIVLNCRALARFARLPIPVVTAAGRTSLPAFRPERASVCGRQVDCLIAITRERLSAEALVPPVLCCFDKEKQCSKDS